jgi:GST-like protein
MIELHTWGTPNGRKVSIMLEECGLPYSVHKIDISKGEQFKPEFLKISPNNRIPAALDPDGPGGKPISLFESGAILIYLAEKTGKFLSKDPVQKYKTLEWLMWQMGGVGPMFGQAHHFLRAAPSKIEYSPPPPSPPAPTTRSPTWRSSPGRRGMSGTPSISPTSPTSNAGTTSSTPALP